MGAGKEITHLGEGTVITHAGVGKEITQLGKGKVITYARSERSARRVDLSAAHASFAAVSAVTIVLDATIAPDTLYATA